jgi:8-oxo-dGTP diphosphatase
MAYVACDIVSGTAYVADTEELADLAWVTPDRFTDFVPYGFAPVVQDYLDSALTTSN